MESFMRPDRQVWFISHGTAVGMNHHSSVINADRPLLLQCTNVSLGATRWKMSLRLWTWTVLGPFFPPPSTSSFEDWAKLPRLLSSLIWRIWSLFGLSLRASATLLEPAVRQFHLEKLSIMRVLMVMDRWNHVTYRYAGVHARYRDHHIFPRTASIRGGHVHEHLPSQSNSEEPAGGAQVQLMT